MDNCTQPLTSLELCAGAGGEAVGLELAGFTHIGLVENDKHACATLRLNRPNWNVIEHDLTTFDARPYVGVDLVSGGVPCPPFSHAGQQLGDADERNMFPEALRVVRQCRPRAVMIENVRGLLDKDFAEYRAQIDAELTRYGYTPEWKLLNAKDFGVPQLRPRVVLVGIRKDIKAKFKWPDVSSDITPTVGEALYELMAVNGWSGAEAWREAANSIAPTLVGGSKKHGGPDLGPTRAKAAWASLGVNGHLIGNEPPTKDFEGMPTLTVPMVAKLQGFPSDWQFAGKKTNAYRQVGNAFPPPVAAAVAREIKACLDAHDKRKIKRSRRSIDAATANARNKQVEALMM